ncbi:hypothetical protein PV328_011966 [Microctonus aethiopoides]|uniref:Uncharacterized protein n=1 Tax=Microctonus aethiopoides TaxID=144406 RepID=A0AA39EZN7_9HYME|nr:hypothetical protein PV328_011966 [Microctonus aethiopoides]
MEGSRLQKLKKLRDLTQRYAEIAAELGIVENPTARSLVMEVLKEKVREKNLQVVLAGPERRMKIQFRIREETQYPTIVAGIPCERCGHSSLQLMKREEVPTRVCEVPMPRLRPPLRSDTANKALTVMPLQRPLQRPMFKPVPYLSREESEEMTPIRRTLQKSVRGLGAHGAAGVVKSAWFTRTAHGATPSNTG